MTKVVNKEAYAKYEQQVNAIKQKKTKKELYESKEWYTIRAILGNDWANWFVLIGARERSWENIYGSRLCIKLFLQS